MEQNILCPIWGTTALLKAKQDYGRVWIVKSPRAGGQFHLVGLDGNLQEKLSPAAKARLSSWIHHCNKAGVKALIDRDCVVAAETQWQSKSVRLRIDTLLDELILHTDQLGDFVDLRDVEPLLCAATECKTGQELEFLLEALSPTHVRRIANEFVEVSPEGFMAAHRRSSEVGLGHRVFVAMWFDPSMDVVFRDGIDAAIRGAGYEALRIDKKDHLNRIDEEIISEIRSCKFVVADFTSEPEKPRGGVYFEAGFALGLGRQVVWLCRNDLIDNVHFDTRQFSHILWHTPSDLSPHLSQVGLSC